MKKSETALPVRKSSPSWIILLRALSAAGIGLSAYLLWGALTQDHLPGCGAESGCNAVLHSRWSSWFGIPVSAFAFLIYAVVFGSSWVLQNRSEPSTRQRTWCVLFSSAAALAAAAVWFISLQLFVVRAICPFCMVAHACGLATAFLLLAELPRTKAEQRAAKETQAAPLQSATVAKSVFWGLAVAIILVVGQIVQPFKTYDVQPMTRNDFSMTNLPANKRSGTSHDAITNSPPAVPEKIVAPSRRIFQLHGDLFSLDLHDVPLHGSPEAQNVIVHLFDYSCSHCRQLHPILTETVHGLDNQLAVISLPMPLDGACNHLMQRPIPDHTNACAYARTGLAVWRANPEKLAIFDDWIFSPARPPSPDIARAEAMRLVGTNAFEVALRDPWIDRQLNLSIRLYETNSVRYRKSRLPQMMIGTNIITGIPPNAAALYQFLASQFKLQPPAATRP